MKYKEIKLEDNKSILVDESAEIKKNTNTFNEGLNGDWFYNSIYKSIARIGDITAYDFKIIATINHSISLDVPMVIIEDEIKKLARKYANITHDRALDEEERYYGDYKKYDGFIAGYKAAQQKCGYSEEDLRAAIIQAYLIGVERSPYDTTTENEIIQSLSKETIELETRIHTSIVSGVLVPHGSIGGIGLTRHTTTKLRTTRDSNGQLIAYIKK